MSLPTDGGELSNAPHSEGTVVTLTYAVQVVLVIRIVNEVGVATETGHETANDGVHAIDGEGLHWRPLRGLRRR